MNPIEEAFSKIKHFLRRHHDYYYTAAPNAAGDEGEVGDDAGDGILFDMYEVLDIITADIFCTCRLL